MVRCASYTPILEVSPRMVKLPFYLSLSPTSLLGSKYKTVHGFATQPMDPKEKAEPSMMEPCPMMFAQNKHGMTKDYLMVL